MKSLKIEKKGHFFGTLLELSYLENTNTCNIAKWNVFFHISLDRIERNWLFVIIHKLCRYLCLVSIFLYRLVVCVSNGIQRLLPKLRH